MWATLLELFFPKGCCACGARPVEGAFCPACASLLEVPPAWRCRLCAGPLPPPLESVDRGTQPERCPACVAHPPAFSELAAPFVYGGAIADSIHRLKYRRKREVAASLGSLVAVPCARLLSSVDVVAPIPLHRSRRLERGYDQAALLAKEIARVGDKPFRPTLLERVRDTPRQVGRNRRERSQNLVGAFRVRGEAAGLRVAIVDDVVTTGATVAAAAEALAGAGAANVVVLAVARAM